MLSRVAENLYWISRYVERAENVARLLDDAFHLEMEAGTGGPQSPLDNVLYILNCREAFDRLNEPPPPSTKARDAAWSPDDPTPLQDRREAVLHFLTFDRSDVHSIRSMMARAREGARSTQDTLTTETWSHLNKMYLYLASPKAEERFKSSAFRFLAHTKRECILFAAIVDGTLPRTEVFHFLQVGRYLERIDMLSRILNTHCHQLEPASVGAAVNPLMDGEPFAIAPKASPDAARGLMHWSGLLRSCSAHEAYLRQSRERIEPARVVRYVLLEENFPRSMRFGVMRCLESLRALAGGSLGYSSDAERHLGRLDSELRYMDIEEVMGRGISPFLAQVQDCCAAVGRDVHQAYFRT